MSTAKTTKTKMAKAKGTIETLPHFSVGRVTVPWKEANKSFATKTQASNKPDANVEAFLSIIERSLATCRVTISFSEVCRNAKPYDIEHSVLVSLWQRWTQAMLNLNKIETFPNIMDEEMFLILG